MTAPSVSVVIPTHARPELMKRAVESVIAQRYDGRVEIIVVFDACDPDLPVVELDARHDLRGLVNSRTPGLAGARNTGILGSSHAYVAFLDDDDYWLPNKLEFQMGAFAAHPETILVGTGMRVDDGSSTHDRLLPFDRVTHSDLVRDRLAALHSSSFMFRRSSFSGALGLVDEELPRSYGEDYDLLLRTATLSTIIVVNLPLVAVSWSGQSYFFGRWADYANALKYLLAKHPEFTGNRRALGRIESQIAYALAASGEKVEARSWAKRALADRFLQPKAVLAIAISFGWIHSDTVVRAARRFGKGI